jgi:hypothetical protein
MNYKNNLLLQGATHVTLQKDGIAYDGVYNGLSYWGRVFEKDTDNLVDRLETDFDEQWGNISFTLKDFQLAGYTVL